MAKGRVARRGAGLAHSVIVLTLLLAGCGPQFGGPAPVVNGGESPSSPREIVIQRGQTLSGIAHANHVPMQAVAEANHLAPPYRILAGGILIIPGGMGPVATGGFAGPPVAPAAEAQVASATLPPPPSQSSPPAELASRAPPPDYYARRPTPLGPAAPPLPRSEIASREPPGQPAGAIPSEGSPPTAPEATLTPPGGTAASAPPQAPRSAPAQLKASPAAPPAPGAVATAEPPPATPPAAHRGGSFLWPVRGHVLENYGTGPDGTHNDGINIAAPRGAPVQATDAGVVAYAGNELRGYGNLILIKHPNGWISAYAHCDLILVKTGQKVARGQVIARVGSTGNVNEPQLHFELRRGKHPVDPRDYLAPLPSAATKPAHAG